jgi:hypothetical protein
VAEENVNYQKDVSASEGANADDRTVKTANLPSPPLQEEPSWGTQQGPLTFDPSPPTEEAEDVQLLAANKQAELMQWHYRLGHLTFPKLKQLALNGKIPKKLAKVLPPKCAGCLFGAMTKLSWQGKETKAYHELFVATKPGECILVDQMTSTEVGFYAQLKSKLTKKRYKCATVFVNHFSRLHLSTSNLMTSPTKLLLPSSPSSSMLQSIKSRSSITTATMDISTITPSDKHATMQGSNSPSVESIPTFKMASPSKPSVTSQKAHGSNCSMCPPAGRRRSTLLCGHMLCRMPLTFTTTYQCWRTAHLGWNFSAQFE